MAKYVSDIPQARYSRFLDNVIESVKREADLIGLPGQYTDEMMIKVAGLLDTSQLMTMLAEHIHSQPDCPEFAKLQSDWENAKGNPARNRNRATAIQSDAISKVG